jgi:hypothetical protein
MKFYRTIFVRKAMAILTGLLVLNMSFFLAEVDALELLHNKQMVENIARLIMGAATEEEKDISGCAEEGTFVKKIDLLFADDHIPPCAFITIRRIHGHDDAEEIIVRSSDTISPPPKA